MYLLVNHRSREWRQIMYKKLDDNTIAFILETGIDEFAETGLDRANINTIARKAKVSVGVIYKYFGDKESFFLACVRHSLKSLDAVLKDAVAHETDVESGIRSIVSALIVHAEDHKSHNAMYNEISSGSCKKYAAVLAREIETRSAAVYSELLENARVAGTVDPELDPKLFAFFLDDLFMMLQFSFSCDYYRERLKIFCGEDALYDVDKITVSFMRFVKNALKIKE